MVVWLTIAVVFLVAITIAGDDEPSSAGQAATTEVDADADSRTADDAGATDAESEADGAASDASGSDDGSTSSNSDGDEPPSSGATSVGGEASGDPGTTRPEDGSAAAPTTTRAGTPPATTVAGTPPATTVAAAEPPTTTTTPPTTIVVTAPPTTITVTVPPALTTTVPPAAPLEDCTVLGADEFGDIEIELTTVSPSTTVSLLEVGFVLRDTAGAEVLADFLLVEFAAPGEVFRLAIPTFEPVPEGADVASLSCEIGGVEVIDLFTDQRLPGPDDTCSVLGVDDIGDLQLDVTVRNPAPESADLIFTYAVRDQQGTRVISDVGFADGLDPGQVATQQVDTLIPPPAGLDPAALTCDVVGLELF